MKSVVTIVGSFTLTLVVIMAAMGAGAGPGGGPGGGAGGGGSSSSGSASGGGALGIISQSRKNTEFGYNGLITNINQREGFIEIRNNPVRPNEEWWIRPMKISTGQDTKVLQNKTDVGLNNLVIGQNVQIKGIWPQAGGNFTTDYWGYQGREISHGTIQILKNDNRIIEEHQDWVTKENIRRAKYGLPSLRER